MGGWVSGFVVSVCPQPATSATPATAANSHGLITCVHRQTTTGMATAPRAAPDRGVCTAETCLCVATGKSHPLKTN